MIRSRMSSRVDAQLALLLASADLQRLAPILAAQDITTVALLRAMSTADHSTLGITIGSRIRLELELEKSSTSTTTQMSRQPPPGDKGATDHHHHSSPSPSLWRPDPTVPPLPAPLDAAMKLALLAQPPRPTRDSHGYGRRLRDHDALFRLVEQGTSRGDALRRRCRRSTFHMHMIDGLGAVGSRCIAALLQSAALGLNDTRCASLGSGATVTTLYQLRPQATPTLPPLSSAGASSASKAAAAPRAMPPAYCHRSVTFADNIQSIERGARIDEQKEKRELRIGSGQWWSTMTCWPVPMWGCTRPLSEASTTSRPGPPSLFT